jgi:N-acetylglucosaminyl-diphospho-decaprenol L-rhamnosyltransferase
MTSLSVVTVTYRSEATIGLCLRALPAACEGLAADAFVVDNNSDDFTLDAARDAAAVIDEQVPVKLVPRSSNSGFAVGSNVGMQRALQSGAEWVLFLNPDAVLPPGAATRLIEVAQSWPRPALVAPALLNLDGTPQAMVERTYRVGRTLAGMARIGGANRAKPAPSDGPPVRVDWFHGAVVLASSELLRRLGGWDEGYFLYGEDMDLCLRAQRAGADCVVVPEVKVPHVSGASSLLGGGEVARAADRVAGMGRFLRKEHGRWAGVVFGVATMATSAPAALIGRARGDALATSMQWAKTRAGLRTALGLSPKRR